MIERLSDPEHADVERSVWASSSWAPYLAFPTAQGINRVGSRFGTVCGVMSRRRVVVAGRSAVLVTFATVLCGLAAACSAEANGLTDDNTSVSVLHDDLTTPVAVAICSDDRCSSLDDSPETMTPGQTMPANVSSDVHETYAVNVSGQPTRCLLVPSHPYPQRPTLQLSGAKPCAQGPAAAAPGIDVVGWLGYVAVLLVSVLAWVASWRTAAAVHRRLGARSTGRAVAVTGAAVGGLATLLLLWPYVLMYVAGRRFGWWRAGRPAW